MSQPAIQPRKLRRFELSERELALIGDASTLSVEDSKRMATYLESGEQHPAIEAWLANPVGPVPWPETRS